MSKRLAKSIRAGLEDILLYKQGKLDLRNESLVMPKPPAEYKANQIKKIREHKKYSQAIFAKILNVSIKTVQSWESGQRHPSHAALRLLEIIDKGIYNPDLHKRR